MGEGKRAVLPSVSICAECGGPAGEAATPATDGEGVICRACSYARTVGDVNQKVSDAAAVREAALLKQDGPGKLRKAIGLGLFLCVVVGIAIVWTPVVASSVAAERPYCVGDTGGEAPGLDACLSGLWEIRAALGVARFRGNGELPGSLGDLEGIPASCPGCGGKWIYEKNDDGGYRIACPTPEKHERHGVFLDHIHGPPQVQMTRASDGGES